MDTVAVCIVVCTITFWAGYNVGYQKTHETVAAECTKFGSFHVGDQGFKCTEISVKE